MKLLIVEDEFAIAMNTELQLKTKGYEVIGIANDFNSIISIITEDTPDLILMDINLGDGGNGIDIARKLKKFFHVPVVFLSAYSDNQTVSDALETEPFGYLVKPYKIEDLDIAIKIARNNWIQKLEDTAQLHEHKKDEFIFLQSGSKVVKTRYEEILFLQALDNYTIIQTKNNKIIVSDYLSGITKKINHPSLLQTHRSYYVNKENIDSVNGNTVYIGNFEIPISRSNRQDFLDRLKLI